MNLKKTKEMVSGLKGEALKVDLCAKCSKRVITNLVICAKCGKWMH